MGFGKELFSNGFSFMIGKFIWEGVWPVFSGFTLVYCLDYFSDFFLHGFHTHIMIFVMMNVSLVFDVWNSLKFVVMYVIIFVVNVTIVVMVVHYIQMVDKV